MAGVSGSSGSSGSSGEAAGLGLAGLQLFQIIRSITVTGQEEEGRERATNRAAGEGSAEECEGRCS